MYCGFPGNPFEFRMFVPDYFGLLMLCRLSTTGTAVGSSTLEHLAFSSSGFLVPKFYKCIVASREIPLSSECSFRTTPDFVSDYESVGPLSGVRP
jgi:hypothetical protein